MCIASALLLRIVTGFLLSWILGYLAFFVAFVFVDFVALELSFVVSGLGFRFLWFSSAGVAAGVGVYIAWLGNGGPRWVGFAMPVLVVLAGFGGAWFGYFYSLWTDEGLAWIFLWERSTVTALIGASMCANAAGAAIGIAVQMQLSRQGGDVDYAFYRYLGRRRW